MTIEVGVLAPDVDKNIHYNMTLHLFSRYVLMGKHSALIMCTQFDDAVFKKVIAHVFDLGNGGCLGLCVARFCMLPALRSMRGLGSMCDDFSGPERRCWPAAGKQELLLPADTAADLLIAGGQPSCHCYTSTDSREGNH